MREVTIGIKIDPRQPVGALRQIHAEIDSLLRVETVRVGTGAGQNTVFTNRLRAARDEAAEARRLADNQKQYEYRQHQVSAAEYRGYLDGRLRDEKEYTARWMQLARERQRVADAEAARPLRQSRAMLRRDPVEARQRLDERAAAMESARAEREADQARVKSAREAEQARVRSEREAARAEQQAIREVSNTAKQEAAARVRAEREADRLIVDSHREVQRDARMQSTLRRANDAAIRDIETARAARYARLTAIGSGLSTAGRDMTYGVSLPAVAVSAYGVREMMSRDRAFADVRKVYTDSTPAQLDKVKADLIAISHELPITFQELTKLANFGGQLGVSTENLSSFVRIVAQLGIATDLTGEEAATGMAKVSAAMGVSEKDFGRFGNALAAASKFGNSTTGEILEMSRRIASVGAQAKMSVPDILALSSAVTSLGQNEEAGGTAIMKFISQMTSAVATNSKQLNAFAAISGVSVAQFKQQFEKDAFGATVMFVRGLAQLSKEGKASTAVLEQMGIKGTYERTALINLAQGLNLAVDGRVKFNEAWDHGNQLQEATNKVTDTQASKFQILQNKVNDVAASFGEALSPSLLKALPAFQQVLKYLADVVKGFSQLPQSVQELIVIGALAGVALGPFLMTAGGMVSGISSIAKALDAMQAAKRARELSDLAKGAESLGGKLPDVVGKLGDAKNILTAPFTEGSLGALFLKGSAVTLEVAIAAYLVKRDIDEWQGMEADEATARAGAHAAAAGYQGLAKSPKRVLRMRSELAALDAELNGESGVLDKYNIPKVGIEERIRTLTGLTSGTTSILSVPTQLDEKGEPLEDNLAMFAFTRRLIDRRGVILKRIKELQSQIRGESIQHAATSNSSGAAGKSAAYNQVLEMARNAGDPHPEVVAAQFMLESAGGRSPSGRFNYFGIKGRGSTRATSEVVGGRTIRTQASFKDYDSLEEGIADRVRLTSRGRYAKAGYGSAKTTAEAIDALAAAGYATDPSYAAKLRAIISTHGGAVGRFTPGLTTHPHLPGGPIDYDPTDATEAAYVNIDQKGKSLEWKVEAALRQYERTGDETWLAKAQEKINEAAAVKVKAANARAAMQAADEARANTGRKEPRDTSKRRAAELSAELSDIEHWRTSQLTDIADKASLTPKETSAIRHRVRLMAIETQQAGAEEMQRVAEQRIEANGPTMLDFHRLGNLARVQHDIAVDHAEATYDLSVSQNPREIDIAAAEKKRAIDQADTALRERLAEIGRAQGAEEETSLLRDVARLELDRKSLEVDLKATANDEDRAKLRDNIFAKDLAIVNAQLAADRKSADPATRAAAADVAKAAAHALIVDELNAETEDGIRLNQAMAEAYRTQADAAKTLADKLDLVTKAQAAEMAAALASGDAQKVSLLGMRQRAETAGITRQQRGQDASNLITAGIVRKDAGLTDFGLDQMAGVALKDHPEAHPEDLQNLLGFVDDLAKIGMLTGPAALAKLHSYQDRLAEQGPVDKAQLDSIQHLAAQIAIKEVEADLREIQKLPKAQQGAALKAYGAFLGRVPDIAALGADKPARDTVEGAIDGLERNGGPRRRNTADLIAGDIAHGLAQGAAESGTGFLRILLNGSHRDGEIKSFMKRLGELAAGTFETAITRGLQTSIERSLFGESGEGSPFRGIAGLFRNRRRGANGGVVSGVGPDQALTPTMDMQAASDRRGEHIADGAAKAADALNAGSNAAGQHLGRAGKIVASDMISGAMGVAAILSAKTKKQKTGGILGGIVGFALGSILPGLGNMEGFAIGSSLGAGLGFAEGGVPPIGKLSVVGERGPELFMPAQLGRVFPTKTFTAGSPADDFSNPTMGANIGRMIEWSRDHQGGQMADMIKAIKGLAATPRTAEINQINHGVSSDVDADRQLRELARHVQTSLTVGP